MKLELKHLAPYLPYGLKTKGTAAVMNGRMCELLSTYDYTERRPILRPLSDLTDKFTSELNTDLSVEMELWDFRDQRLGYWQLSYSTAELLFEHHFDVFGLIEKGLAIDINTVPDE